MPVREQTRVRKFVAVVIAVLGLAGCSSGGGSSSAGTPSSPAAASSASTSSTSAFCSTLKQFVTELAGDTQNTTDVGSLVSTMEQQSTSAISVLNGQEDGMDLATKTHADVVIADINDLATWTPNSSKGLTDTIKAFGTDSASFNQAYCTT